MDGLLDGWCWYLELSNHNDRAASPGPQTTSKAQKLKFCEKPTLLWGIAGVFYGDFIWLHEQQLGFKLKRWLKIHTFSKKDSLQMLDARQIFKSCAPSRRIKHVQVTQTKFRNSYDFICKKSTFAHYPFFWVISARRKFLAGANNFEKSR